MILCFVVALLAGTPDASMKNESLLAALTRLHALSLSNPDRNELRNRVAATVPHFSDLEDVARLALLSRDMTTGLAENESIDLVFWTAFWVCAERLAEQNDEQSVLLLKRLADRGELGGGERLLMERLQAQQRTLGKRKRKED